MIYIKHPKLSRVAFYIGNATVVYHNRAKSFEPSETEYLEWLEELPVNVRVGMEKRGFNECKYILSFTRFVMEKNDIGQEEFIRSLVSDAIYDEYLQICLK